MLPERVQQKLDSLPTAPGVYLFEDRAGAVLYVGKARNLRSRVRSYFQPGSSDERIFVAYLESELADLSTFVVSNEKEAALLENELIKRHQPRYNVKLRDDKDFLSIRVDPSDPWPRLSVVRRPKPDGARYYGPYESATSARQTLRQINRFFKLRTCKDSDFRSRARPCLQHQIKRCPAPCVKEVDRDEYLAQVDLVGLFLEGRHDRLVEDLERRMREAAEDLRYEQAATYRDQLRAVERVRTAQRIATVRDVDQDVVGLHRAGDQAEVALLEVRGGHLSQVRTFELREMTLPDDELLSSFVSEYYRHVSGRVPDELVLPMPIEAQEGLEAWLSDERGKRMRVLVPQRGNRVRLLEMAAENAAHAYREKQRAREDLEGRLGELQKKLRLSALPRRIECVDVSHLGGTDTVAAITALTDGAPDKRRYRTFRIKRVDGGDDYGAMYEVLSRRFRRGRDEEEGWELPDLFVVDGGKGQLNVALAALKDLGVEGLELAALAKERSAGGETTQVERVFLPGQMNAIPLPARSASRHFLATVRDEAHRVSNRLRQKVGKRRRLKSGLDDIPGVGPKTRARLLKRLGTLKSIAEADVETLREAGANRRQARAIYRTFHGGAPPGDAAEAERAALDNAFE
ncbi:MAG TPA: excinuclease ABC subunit UvrC [Sandaracinaceae bacterium LLY-WYZ-13_1]|nr:excinuclease ABC subunit UvrC [Sandaracinaceae bacterium LLY-WYZ-13_1]